MSRILICRPADSPEEVLLGFVLVEENRPLEAFFLESQANLFKDKRGSWNLLRAVSYSHPSEEHIQGFWEYLKEIPGYVAVDPQGIKPICCPENN